VLEHDKYRDIGERFKFSKEHVEDDNHYEYYIKEVQLARDYLTNYSEHNKPNINIAGTLD
jgi:hypothetical protein